MCEQFLPKVKTIIAYLFLAYRERWREVSHYRPKLFLWYFPMAEKRNDVVYADCIIVFFHALQYIIKITGNRHAIVRIPVEWWHPPVLPLWLVIGGGIA